MNSNPGATAILSELGVPMSKMELLEQRINGGRADSLPAADTSAAQETVIDVDSMDMDQSQGESSQSEPSRKRKRNFTPEEDQRIQEGCRKFGNQWEQVAQWAGIDRTAQQIRSRHARLMKQQKTDGSASPSMPPRKKVKASPKGEGGDSSRTFSSPKKQTTLTLVGLSPGKSSSRGSLPGALTLSSNAVNTKAADEAAAALAARERTLAKRELELSAREKVVKQLMEEHVQKQAQPEPVPAAARSAADEEREKRQREALIELLVREAEAEKEARRREVAKGTARIGSMVVERRGATFGDTWRPGEEHTRLTLQIKALEQRKEKREKLRKQLSRQRSVLSKQRTDDGADVSALEAEMERFVLQEEMLKLDVIALRKEESELQLRLERLDAEKVLHVRRVKRLRDQTISRFNDHPVLENKYVLLNILGKGGFSEVFKAYDLEENCEVACKIHQLNNQWGELRKKNYIKHALREYNIFKTIDHPSVVGLRGVFEIDQNGFCTVLEYCNDGDLDIKLKTNGRLSEREARCIITQVFTGLVHLNKLERPVIHYDLKPGNILFHEGQVKLTDFGLAKVMEEDMPEGIELTSQGAGTYWYLPPECLVPSATPPKISSKVDVWSAGVILYQMLFGKKPFGHNVSQKQILQDRIISTDALVSFPTNPKVSEDAKEFIKLCLEPSQAKRPDVLTISTHPYLAAYKPKPLPPK